MTVKPRGPRPWPKRHVNHQRGDIRVIWLRLVYQLTFTDRTFTDQLLMIVRQRPNYQSEMTLPDTSFRFWFMLKNQYILFESKEATGI